MKDGLPGFGNNRCFPANIKAYLRQSRTAPPNLLLVQPSRRLFKQLHPAAVTPSRKLVVPSVSTRDRPSRKGNPKGEILYIVDLPSIPGNAKLQNFWFRDDTLLDKLRNHKK